MRELFEIPANDKDKPKTPTNVNSNLQQNQIQISDKDKSKSSTKSSPNLQQKQIQISNKGKSKFRTKANPNWLLIVMEQLVAAHVHVGYWI